MNDVRQHPRARWAAGFAVCGTAILAACSEPPVTPREVPPAVQVIPQLFIGSEPTEFEFLGFVTDVGGPNDTPAQSDLNAFTRADNVTGPPSYIGVKWVWDDVNSWTGTGQTGDACALFDTGGKTNADAAVCVRIENPNGDPTIVQQLPAPASPLVYSCGDTKADRCGSQINPKPLGGVVCVVEKINGETFFPAGEDGADVMATCSIPLAAISATSTPNLLNVCSFPSGSPNSNPFDCVVTPGAGFLIIKKATSPQSSGQTFSFTISPALVSGSSKSLTDNTANDEQTALLSAAAGTYSVTEGTLPTGWSLDNATCEKQTTPPTGTGTKSGNAVTGISITSGETTVCTFTNSQATPTISVVKTAGTAEVDETGGTVTYTVTVTNTSSISVTLSSLIDDKFGDLDGKGTCNSASNPTNPYGTLAPSGTYTCTFDGTLAATQAGTIHVNEVTASATANGNTVSAKDTAKVTFKDVKPSISVTKAVDITEILAQGGASVAGFNPDQTFARGAGGGGGGSPVFASNTCDDAGANDQPAQSDLNCFTRADDPAAGRLWLRWTWDDINSWTGTGQTGDACALLDIDNNSKANYAFCVRITNLNGDPTQIVQVSPGSPILYKCKDTAQNPGENDRCASKVLTQNLDATSICTVSLVADQLQGGEDGQDSQAQCNLKLTDLGQNLTDIDLLNVCSFPSGSPNSAPFDCVVTPAAGFLVINKSTTPADADAYFAFTIRNEANTANATATNGDDDFAVQGGATSSAIPILPGTYALRELMPTGWSLDANGISCTRNGVSIGGSTSTTTRLGVTIVQGQTTVCTFDNSLVGSGEVTFTVTVTNNSLEDVTLFSLEDTENPDDASPTYTTLNSVGTCATGGTIVNGTPYQCTFKRTISGTPGTTHNDKVRAVGKDDDNNSDTKTSNKITVTITSSP